MPGRRRESPFARAGEHLCVLAQLRVNVVDALKSLESRQRCGRPDQAPEANRLRQLARGILASRVAVAAPNALQCRGRDEGDRPALQHRQYAVVDVRHVRQARRDISISERQPQLLETGNADRARPELAEDASRPLSRREAERRQRTTVSGETICTAWRHPDHARNHRDPKAYRSLRRSAMKTRRCEFSVGTRGSTWSPRFMTVVRQWRCRLRAVSMFANITLWRVPSSTSMSACSRKSNHGRLMSWPTTRAWSNSWPVRHWPRVLLLHAGQGSVDEYAGHGVCGERP